MHDIRFIRDNPEVFDHALARRGLAPDAKRLIELDEKRRARILELETAQARRNAASKEIGEAKKNKDDEKANVEHHRFGAKRDYAFAPKQHFELGEALGQMDFEAAAKLSGARFVVLKRGLARLERALGQFMLDVHTSEPHNYTEVSPPLLVRDEVMFGTAQLPKFVDDQFAAVREITFTERQRTAAEKWIKDYIQKKVDEVGALAVALGKLEIPIAAAALLSDPNVEPAKELFWLIPTAEVPL